METSVAVRLFVTALKRLPNLVAIVFEAGFCTPIDVVECLIVHPHITSISFTAMADALSVWNPPPTLDTTMGESFPLTKFSYIVPSWREQTFEFESHRADALLKREEQWLSAIVPKAASTLKHLDIPMETSPMLHMAKLSWPELQDLSISGRYANADQKEALPLFLSSLTRLRKLSVTICRCGLPLRPPILGFDTTSHITFDGLRSLTVAYPDPDDRIFSIDASHLRHLSLRDSPRYYHDCSKNPQAWSTFVTPILQSAECLSILRRMDMPRLSSLELVYLADTAGSDDELLSYVTHTYPHLSHLQLHRYRANREEAVDYVRTLPFTRLVS